jgi:hypothetical protein
MLSVLPARFFDSGDLVQLGRDLPAWIRSARCDLQGELSKGGTSCGAGAPSAATPSVDVARAVLTIPEVLLVDEDTQQRGWRSSSAVRQLLQDLGGRRASRR